MLPRIRKAYERQFRDLMGRFGARRPDRGVAWLFARAEQIREREAVPMARALARVHGRLLRQSVGRHPAGSPRTVRSSDPVPGFLCDAGLGGLARWLRAAGYDARWEEGIEDAALVKAAARKGWPLLTTDSLLMERRPIQRREVMALWLPPTLTPGEQLRLVLDEFDLELRESRCMHCGGELQAVPKAAVEDRIPPKTRRWLDEYYACRRCNQLFWHGTHWERIQRRLEEMERRKIRR